jgi:transposase
MNNIHQRRIKRTSEEWRKILEQAEASQLSVERFCARESICPQTFYAWRKRLRTEVIAHSFTPVVVGRQTPEPPTAPPPPPPSSAINQPTPDVEIVLRNGRIVRIAGKMYEAHDFRALLAVVEGEASC